MAALLACLCSLCQSICPSLTDTHSTTYSVRLTLFMEFSFHFTHSLPSSLYQRNSSTWGRSETHSTRKYLHISWKLYHTHILQHNYMFITINILCKETRKINMDAYRIWHGHVPWLIFGMTKDTSGDLPTALWAITSKWAVTLSDMSILRNTVIFLSWKLESRSVLLTVTVSQFVFGNLMSYFLIFPLDCTGACQNNRWQKT